MFLLCWAKWQLRVFKFLPPKIELFKKKYFWRYVYILKACNSVTSLIYLFATNKMTKWTSYRHEIAFLSHWNNAAFQRLHLSQESHPVSSSLLTKKSQSSFLETINPQRWTELPNAVRSATSRSTVKMPLRDSCSHKAASCKHLTA